MGTKIDIDAWMLLRRQAKREMVGARPGTKKALRSAAGVDFTAVVMPDGTIDLPGFDLTGRHDGGRVILT